MQRLTRCQKLVKPAQFKCVFAHPKRSSDAYFTVLGHNNQKLFARLGLAIARKQIKKAVGRNRIKRLVRESFRHHQHELKGWDFVVLVRKDVSQYPSQKIYASLDKHWHAFAPSIEK